MGLAMGVSAPGDTRLLWPPSSVWILKVHRYLHVSLQLKEEQPNVGALPLQAAWVSCRQSLRLHPPAARCPQHR